MVPFAFGVALETYSRFFSGITRLAMEVGNGVGEFAPCDAVPVLSTLTSINALLPVVTKDTAAALDALPPEPPVVVPEPPVVPPEPPPEPLLDPGFGTFPVEVGVAELESEPDPHDAKTSARIASTTTNATLFTSAPEGIVTSYDVFDQNRCCSEVNRAGLLPTKKRDRSRA
jgi:hypothetical protein